MFLAEHFQVMKEVDQILQGFRGCKLIPDSAPANNYGTRPMDILAAVKAHLKFRIPQTLFVVVLDQQDPTKIDVFGASYDQLKILEIVEG